MVERQRREGDFLAFLAGARKPVAHLLEVGEEVAVREDGALGNAGRAARVLQEGDVGVVDLMGGEAVAAADLKRFVEADGVRERVFGHHLLYLAHDEVDERALEEREEVADGGRDDVLALRAGQGVLECLGEVLDDDDRLRLGVAQRAVDLAGGVERVDVDDDVARAQAGVHGDDVLQKVRHHDGDAVAGLEAETLEVGGEFLGERSRAAVGQAAVHVGVPHLVGVARGDVVEDGRNARIAVRIDFVRDACGVALVPGKALSHVLVIFEFLRWWPA